MATKTTQEDMEIAQQWLLEQGSERAEERILLHEQLAELVARGREAEALKPCSSSPCVCSACRHARGES